MAAERFEGLHEVAFELAADAQLIVGEGGMLRAANKRARELFKLDPQALAERTLDELLGSIAAELNEAFGAGLPTISLRGRMLPGPVESSGSRIDVSASFLPGEGRRRAAYLVNLRRAAATAHRPALEQSRESVGERLRALSELAAGVAHNFNNALTSILAHTQVLVRSEELPEWAREDLRVIERVSRGAAATVRRIQGFARTRDPNVFEPLDLADVVANAVALTRPRWRPAEHSSKFELAWTPSEAPLPIEGNGAELCEVIVNLIDNALEAMPGGGKLSITTGLDAAQVWVEIRDNGVGIDESSRPRLFDPFFSSKGRHGQGLGLPVSHGVVERHRGEISIEDVPEGGTCFRVELPLGKQVIERKRGKLVRARPSVVLLVDDDPIVRRSLTQMLEQLGHQVVGAEHGRDALARLEQREDIELLLTDLAMPILDGAGLLREVVERYPKLPRVLMTGLVADADADLVELTDLMLSKPIDLTVLDRVLARFLPESKD